MSDARPCGGSNANICVAEGCYGEACIHAAVKRSPFTPSAKAARASVRDTAAAKVVGMADGMASERARILALLTDPAVVEDMTRAEFDTYCGEPLWDDLAAPLRAENALGMAAALDVLRARIEEDR